MYGHISLWNPLERELGFIFEFIKVVFIVSNCAAQVQVTWIPTRPIFLFLKKRRDIRVTGRPISNHSTMSFRWFFWEWDTYFIRHFQSSYMSRISQIMSVEKNLIRGEISDFCKEFEQSMEFYRNLRRFCFKFLWRKISVEKKWQI